MMISGKCEDILDSQESVFKEPFFKDEPVILDSQEFHDVWGQNLLHDYPRKSKEDVMEFVRTNSNPLENVTFGAHATSNIKNTADSMTVIYDQAASVLEQLSDYPDYMSMDYNKQNQPVDELPSSTSQSRPNDNISLFSQVESVDLYGFRVEHVRLTDVITKSINYTYSSDLNKLFVQMCELCPIQFRCNIHPPVGTIVKVMAKYKSPQDGSQPVKPCLLHRDQSCGDLMSIGHLIQIPQPQSSVIYGVEESGHQSVSFAFQADNGDCVVQTTRFKFTCLSSCKSGMNRRATKLEYSLIGPEGNVLGRKVVDLCICTRPGRDRMREESKKDEPSCSKRRLRRPNSAAQNIAVEHVSDHEPPSKRQTDTDEVFTMTIKGRKKYEKLLQIKTAFDLEELVGEEQRRSYFQNEANH